jgi:hypothetical protein
MKELLAKEPQLFLGSDAFGDVYARADIPGKLPLLGISWHAVIQDPPILSVGAPETVLHGKGLACFETGGVGLKAMWEVLGMHALRPAIAEFLFHFVRNTRDWHKI